MVRAHVPGHRRGAIDGFELIGDVRDRVDAALVASVFNQLPALLIGGITLSLVAIIAWFRSGQCGFLIWSIAILLVMAGRVCLDVAFHRAATHVRPRETRIWCIRFTIGAWLMGAHLGIAGFLALSGVESFLRLMLLSTLIVVLSGSVTRNAGIPVAVRGQIFLALLPIFAACAVWRTPENEIYGAFIVLQFLGALATMRFLHRQSIRLLATSEENSALARDAERANAKLEEANVRLEAMATTDALTNVGNRRRFDSALREEFRRREREDSELSLLMLDIDSFKRFNDFYGHQAGDACLQKVAQAFSQALRRPADVAARYGGEEFGAVLPRTSAAAATALAEHIRASVAALEIPHDGGVAGIVTVSVGVASFDEGMERPELLISAADAALYAAKFAGRNCVRSAPSVSLSNT